MSTAPVLTYDDLNRNAQPYPGHLLPEGGSGLALFAAGFRGWNDVVHMVRKSMCVECVDKDADRLWEMAQIYDEPMAFHVDDAWEFATKAAAEGRQWDAVSVDPYMGDAAERVWETRHLWPMLATDLVTFTVSSDRKPFEIDGWESYLFPRNDRVGWMVMTRA